MAGDIAGKSPGNNEWISQLKNLEASQISELFDGVCSDCLTLLRSRLFGLDNNLSGLSSSETSAISSPDNTYQQHSGHERNGSKESASTRRLAQNTDTLSPSQVNGKPQMRDLFGLDRTSSDANQGPSFSISNGVSEEEWLRFSQVGRKKNFVHYEKVNGKDKNILEGLELHKGVFSAEEQKQIVESVYSFQKMGRKGQLMARTYSEPKKWMRGKGRVTMQFGCCYNYAVDKDGNPPGIIRDEEVDPLPPVFKQMLSRMVRWHVLPPTCVPNSCIVNIYAEGDCIPPHIDHHDFLRPFCTVSFLTECNILFGSNLKVSAPGEFSGPVSIPLPVGSVLVLKGNGADIAKHCVPAVPAKRISVTFRRMDDSKIPYNFSPDPELLNLKPLRQSSSAKTSVATQNPHEAIKINDKSHKLIERKTMGNSFVMENNDFPPLGGLKSRRR